MITVSGRKRIFCDRLPRRDFLTIGSLAFGGLQLPRLLQAEEKAGVGRSHKSVIMIYLSGGPPHQDMFDLKPDAPMEVRGEFKPIATNVPGIQICEHLPRIAATMDKFAVIRSLIGAQAGHTSFQCATGRTGNAPPPGNWPSIGAIVSKVQGRVNRAVPPAIDLSQLMAHAPYNIPGPGFLGLAHTPFRPDGETLSDMTLNREVAVSRFSERKQLLLKLDRMQSATDELGRRSFDPFVSQAFNVLTSNALVEALDLSREDPKTVERYGTDEPDAVTAGFGKLGYGALMSRFLSARRLVEAGARLVTCSFADFDFHGDNFKRCRRVLPLLDQGVSALVQDLHDRGLDRDVTVIVWGEFGRTPKINASAGRDHWPNVSCALMAGGGMRTGQVIGATDRNASEVIDRPVRFEEVFATLYRNLGIDIRSSTLTDLAGRPQYLIDDSSALRELI